MRSISTGRLDSLIWLVFYTKVASAPILTRSLRLPVVWNYMDFISALPSGSYYLSNWWTGWTWLQEEDYTTLAIVFTLYTAQVKCAQNAQNLIWNKERSVLRLNECETVESAPADLQCTVMLLVAIQRNSYEKAKSVIWFMDTTVNWNQRVAESSMTHDTSLFLTVTV